MMVEVGNSIFMCWLARNPQQNIASNTVLDGKMSALGNRGFKMFSNSFSLKFISAHPYSLGLSFANKNASNQQIGF